MGYFSFKINYFITHTLDTINDAHETPKYLRNI